MSETHTNPMAPEPLKTIAERVHMPLLIFSFSLVVLLFLSWAFLLPRFTNFHLAEQKFSPSETVAYEQSLKAQLALMEEKRQQLVLPILDATYDKLKHAKNAQPTLFSIRDVLNQAALSATISQEQLHIASMSLDVTSHQVTVNGDVRNVDLRSMTLLAAFVEQLEKDATIRDVTRPTFMRNVDPAIGMFSPFTISFVLAE